MDKRFLAWLFLTAGMFLLWSSLRQRFAPPDADVPSAATAPQGSSDLRGAATEAVGSAEPTRTEDPLSQPSEEEEKLPEVSPSWHTLGSMRPEEGFRLLVTLSSRGGGIERIELVEQEKEGKFRYRNIETESGYWGYLALTEESQGLRIQVVPSGSPAADAVDYQTPSNPRGLRKGDLIVQVAQTPVKSLADLQGVLARTKPGQDVKVEVQRAGMESAMAFQVKLVQQPMDVIRQGDDQRDEQVQGNWNRLSCLTTLATLDDRQILAGSSALPGLQETLDGHWQAEWLEERESADGAAPAQGVEFRMPLGPWLKKQGIDADLELVKRYWLRPNLGTNSSGGSGYDLELETSVRNRGQKSHRVAFRQEAFNGLTLEGWWYLVKISPHMFEGSGARDIVYSSRRQGHTTLTRGGIVAAARSNPKEPDSLFISAALPPDQRDLRYLGIDGQFFAATLMPHPSQAQDLDQIAQAATRAQSDPSQMVPAKQNAANVSAWLDTLPVEVAAGAEHKRKYLLFAGPKDPELLDRYGLGDLVYYGWFKWWAKPLSWILHTLYAIVRNYGIAIVLLTVLVRSLLFPLTRRASLNAQKMQTLQPEIKRINELYKNDFERRAKETRELYRKHNFNPASGCLPLFIQIPIMIGLYRAVSVDVQLRQQPLIPGFDWCSNLAGPDMLLNWSTWMPDWIAGKGTGWFGPYLNLLPIITVTLFIIQQKVLMPKATDEQQQMAQTMMMYMTIFMGVMFFKVPAGLCIYFITSSIWSLVERHMVKKFAPPAELALDAPATGAAASRPLAARESASKKFDPAKIKSTKPPEKLSDVLPWLAKTKPPEEGTGRSGSPSRDAGSREQRRQRNGKKKT